MRLVRFIVGKSARLALVAALLLLFTFLSMGLGPRYSLNAALSAPLIDRFEPVLPPGGSVDGIIVLGGSQDRMEMTTILARLYPRAQVIVAGRGETKSITYMIEHGVDPSRLLLETRSANTFENAVFTERVVHPEPWQHFILVTSAVHMPRAVGCFRKAGFNVLPWRLDDASTIGSTEHEWFGLLAYRLMGRIDEMLPAPVSDIQLWRAAGLLAPALPHELSFRNSL